MAMVAFSIDSMLPALPEIAQTLTPDAPNRAQLVLTSFVFGMGLGTLVMGPLSDRFGRKPVIFCGALLYAVGAIMAAQAQTLDGMLFSRLLQGIGVAGPRIVAVAMVRDQYEGRPMASIMSYVMMVFTLVPAIAPLLGKFIIDGFGWHAVFYCFVILAVIVVSWLYIRQPETLAPEARVPFKPASLLVAARECFSHRVFILSTVVQILVYGMLFGALSSTQQIFETTFARGEEFPFWFALVALVSGTASILNARLVVRLGMQKLILAGLGMQIAISGLVLLSYATGTLPFSLYLVWTTSMFFMVGLAVGNLNALAMEPVGHVAGMAASVIGALSTVFGVAIAAPIGLAFDGTALPLALASTVLSISAFVLVRRGLR